MGGASAEHAAAHQALLGELDGDRESIVGGMDHHQPDDPENGEKKGGTRSGELRRDVDTEHQPVRACSAPVRASSRVQELILVALELIEALHGDVGHVVSLPGITIARLAIILPGDAIHGRKGRVRSGDRGPGRRRDAPEGSPRLQPIRAILSVIVYVPPCPGTASTLNVPFQGRPSGPLNLQSLCPGEETAAAPCVTPDHLPSFTKVWPMWSSSSAALRSLVPCTTMSHLSVVPSVLTVLQSPIPARSMSGMSRSGGAARCRGPSTLLPGITRTCGFGASEKVCAGTTFIPIEVVTVAFVLATVNTSNPPWPSTSYGPVKSMICTPS